MEVESGLGGRLETLGLPLGGSGNAPMLVGLRKVLPGVGMPEDGALGGGEAGGSFEPSAVFNVGTAGVERALDAALGVGRPVVVTDRVPTLDPAVGIEEDELVLASGAAGMPGNGFLVFGTGKAGSGPEGGASGDVEGRRIPVMVVVPEADMARCS